MSDEWVISLIDEKSPEELTATEIALLRERAKSSPAVRRALAERLQLEQALYTALSSPAVSGSEIIGAARRARRQRLVSIAAGLVLLVAGTTFAWLAIEGKQRVPPRPAVQPQARAVPIVAPKSDDASLRPNGAIAPVEALRPNAAEVAAQPTPPVEQPQAAWPTLADDAPVVPFADSAFQPIGSSIPGYEVSDEFPPSELKRWIGEVPGLPFNVSEGQWRNRRFAGFDGVARLLPAWRDDAVLRIAVFDTNEFALHLWNGTAGRTLRFYPHQRPQLLAAYATTREPQNPTPKTYQLLSTDGGTYSRANAGAIELRHQAGQLVVTRGAVPLLVVPMTEPPAEVFVEAKTRFRTLTMHRGEPASLPPSIEHRELLAESLPQEAAWLVSQEVPASVEHAADRVTLAAPEKASEPRQLCWAGVPLPDGARSGLCEAIFRLEALSPGTGIYLGDAQGRPIHTLFASEDERAGAPVLSYGWTSSDGRMPEPRWRWDLDPQRELAPAAGPGTWVKVLVGPGGLKASFSGDGVHWGPAARSPERAVRGMFASVGMFAVADGKPRTIAVSQVQVRELSGIVVVADAALRARVPAFDQPAPERPADWLMWASASRPDDVPNDVWLQACSVETLAREASDSVSRFVLRGLIADAVHSDRSVEQTLAFLHDAALLLDLWNDSARELATAYEDLTRRISANRGEPAEIGRQLLAVEQAYLASPIWTESRMWAVPPALARDLAAAAAWSVAEGPARAAAQVAAYLAPSHPDGGWSGEEDPGLARLLSWAGRRGTSDGGRIDGQSQYGWQHPLATEPGREGSAVATELRAALEAGAYADAARLLETLAVLADLVPAIDDPSRFLPPAALVVEAAQRHPELVTAIAEQFGDAALLRVRQAIAAKDETAVQLAAIRYFGTPAAVEARQWLGERALAGGYFAQAQEHFAAAAAIADAESRHDLEGRLQLAAALGGALDDPPPIAGPVSFGSKTIVPSDLQNLIGELQKARARSSSDSRPSEKIPDAVPVLAEARGRFAGDVGRNPDRGEYRRFDWVARQIGVTIDRGVLYLTNRFQVVAYDPKRNAPWWTVSLGGEQGEAHALPNVAFTPVVRGERLFVRRLTNRGPELACLSLTEGGKLLWRSDPQSIAVSDPVLEQGVVTLLTNTVSNRNGGPATLSLTRLRADDGSLLATTPVVVMNEAESERSSAHLLAVSGGYVFATQGTVGLCDHDGRIGWLRRLPYLPASVDLDSDRVASAKPIVAEGRMYLAPPGTRSVICLEVPTGRLTWVRPSGEAEELAGFAGDVLVARGFDVLYGIDRETGNTLWSFHRENMLTGTLCSDKTLLATSRMTLDDRLDGLSIMHLDPASGKVTAEQLVRVQRKDEIRCGPLFVTEGLLWGFVGEGWRDPQRTLVSFKPDSSALPVAKITEPPASEEWLSSIEPQTSLLSSIVLPGWTAIGSQTGGGAKYGAPLLDENRGERNVLVTMADRERAARFMQHVTIDRQHAKLVARVGRDDDAGWTLRVFADGDLFATVSVNKEAAPDGWRTATVDLAPLAGRTIELAVDQAGPSDKMNKPTKAYWKSLKVE